MSFPERICKAHYKENGQYINTFGETRQEALDRYRRQANERYQEKRWREKAEPRNSCFVMTILAFNSLVYHTLTK